MSKNNISLAIFISILSMICTATGFADQKSEFVGKLLPSINAVNGEIRVKRQKLNYLEKKRKTSTLSSHERLWLTQLAAEYKIKQPNLNSETVWKELQIKVDVIPPSLAIAQAATESGWGNSRFAKKANNFFGQSCFKKGCGMKPTKNVNKTRTYFESATFRSAHEAVRSYINNLNTHNAYKELRNIRQQQRQQNHTPESLQLAKGLQRYSERGNAYVRYISGMVKKLQPRKLDRELV